MAGNSISTVEVEFRWEITVLSNMSETSIDEKLPDLVIVANSVEIIDGLFE
jgi:hypothetical protein